jgi:hypothetical protein
MKRLKDRDDSRNGWYEITPADAHLLIENQGTNRRLAAYRINRLVAKILAGKYAPNGESIVLTGEGRLLDGQHRLRACITAGKAIISFVVFLPRAVDSQAMFDTIDVGVPRSASDRIYIDGCTSNEKQTAAVIRTLMQWERYGHIGHKGGDKGVGGRISTDQHIDGETIRRYWEKNKKPVTDAVNAVKMYESLLRGWAPASLVGFVYARAAVYSQTKADAFLHGLATGENLEMDSPVMALRRRLQREAVNRERLANDATAALMVKAWNQFASGKGGQLSWDRTRESFPRFIGEDSAEKPKKKERAA